MGFESKKIKISQLDDYSFVFTFGLTFLKHILTFEYDPSKIDGDNLDSISYMPKFGYDDGLIHGVEIDRFQMSPNLDIEKLVITVDYFGKDGSSPSTEDERMRFAKKALYDSTGHLSDNVRESLIVEGKELDDIRAQILDIENTITKIESGDVEYEPGEKDKLLDKKTELEAELEKTRAEMIQEPTKLKQVSKNNLISVALSKFDVAYKADLGRGMSKLMHGKTLTFIITGDEYIESIDHITARKVNITVNTPDGEKRITATDAKEFLRSALPKIKVELYPR